MATCRGVDVSAYQSPQDWAARKREGIVFAFAKASEGMRSRDSRFATHISGIREAGLVPGAYHFGWPTQDVAAEAANYVAAVKSYARPGFVHWLDLERYSDGRNYAGRTAAQIRAWAAAWLAAVRKAFPGQRVGIYTSSSDLAAGHVPAGTPLWYPAYPWGAASYTQAEAAPQPHPSGWTPLIWQFTSTPIDRSICYLSEAALRAWAAGTEETNMQLTDKITLADWIKDRWPDDQGIQDGSILVSTALASGYAHARTASTLSRVAASNSERIMAQLAAQSAAIAELAKALAAHHQEVDADQLVARITAAIEQVTIRLDVAEG